MKKLFFLPNKYQIYAIPLILLLGIVTGNLVDTSFLQSTLLIGTFFMILPTMIGMNLKSVLDLSHSKVILWGSLINFTIIPIVAILIGALIFPNEPALFAGLAISALLPTSGMTISWTMLSKGNVPAAIKMTALSLIAGSILAPIYLKGMIGTAIPMDMAAIFKTIAIIVFLPMILGQVIQTILFKKMSKEVFQKKAKPYFPAFSTWAMLFVIFSSVSMKAPILFQNPALLVKVLAGLLIFYGVNFTISTIVGRRFFNRENALALVFGTVLRNLSIALGIAVTAFGPEAALTVTLAFIIQVQAASWYSKTADKFGFFKPKEKGGHVIGTTH